MRLSRQRKRRLLSSRLTEADLQAVIDESTHWGIRYALGVIEGSMALVLADKLNFSEEEVKKAMDSLEEYFDSIAKDYLSPGDVMETVKDEFNRDIEGKLLGVESDEAI